jgi:hypothetical protein
MALIGTIQVQMHEDYYCEIKKYRGSCGEFYSVNDVNYDIHFPIEWVFQIPDGLENIDKFGPETCYDCFMNGYYNGVFIGYCVDCASFCNYKRGNGLIHGIEREELDYAHIDTKNSIWNLYLQIVSLEEIGDEQLQIDYDYKLNYCQLQYMDIDNNNDNVTITYNDHLIHSSSVDEDENTVTFFSYDDGVSNSNSDSDSDSLKSYEDDDDEFDSIS